MNTLTTHETRELTRQVAGLTVEHLPGFTVDHDPDLAEHRGVYLNGPDGERLFLALDWRNADRVEILGVYPANDERPDRHEIGVGRTRGPDKIAREIERRLLPAYRETLAKIKEKNADREAAREARLAAATPIRDLVNGTTNDDTTRTTVRFYDNATDNGYGDFRFWYRGDRADVDLHNVPAALAHKIAELIAAQ